MKNWRYIFIFVLFALSMTCCNSQNNKILPDTLSSSIPEMKMSGQDSQTNSSKEQDIILTSLLNNDTIREEIDSYMSLFISENTMGSIRTEAYENPFIPSTEGVEIKRYSTNNNVILRYRMIYYEEMGKREENYYLLDDYMYCTSIEEIYGGLITLTEAETLYTQFQEGIMIGEDWYQYDADMDGYVITENKESFFSEEELQSEFARSASHASSLDHMTAAAELNVGTEKKLPSKEEKPETLQAFQVAVDVLAAIKDRDYQLLAEYAHPERGIIFSPDPYVDYREDTVFYVAQIREFASESITYNWGHFDVSEIPLELTANEYFLRFVYTENFFESNHITIRESLV